MLLNPAPAWNPPRSEFINLWHGCTASDSALIKTGISLSKCRIDTDFGQGFYLTAFERQARQWAWNRYYGVPPAARLTPPVTLRFRVPRAELGKLQSLQFVLGDYDSEDYWSLVQHCRQSRTRAIKHHNHPASSQGGWYDVVSGPVAAFWKQRVAMVGADQISFHTPAAIAVLDKLINSGNAVDFSINAVL